MTKIYLKSLSLLAGVEGFDGFFLVCTCMCAFHSLFCFLKVFCNQEMKDGKGKEKWNLVWMEGKARSQARCHPR